MGSCMSTPNANGSHGSGENKTPPPPPFPPPYPLPQMTHIWLDMPEKDEPLTQWNVPQVLEYSSTINISNL